MPEDRRAGAAAGDITKAGSGAGESRNRGAAGGPRLGPGPCWGIEVPQPADSIAPACRRQLTAPGPGAVLAATKSCAGDREISRELSDMTRPHPGLAEGADKG